MTDTPKPPNPGSDEALVQGCSCPVMDNARGRGINTAGTQFWIHEGCPLHGAAAIEARQP